MIRISNKEGIMKLSVRDLVEFIFREGDIDNRRGKVKETDAMQAGSNLHRKIQRRMGVSYTAEVRLSHQVDLEGYSILIEGRADGIITTPEGITIDEIKGMYLDVQSLEKPFFIHQAQAMCYGYIYAVQNALPEIGVQMTYGNLETEELKRFEERFSLDYLTKWFEQLMREYTKWSHYLFLKNERRQKSITGLEFPFPYRKGQRDMTVAVYRTISRKKTLFVQAPTGIGKTMATIFPTVKAVGEGLGDKIFYLTAKTITRTVAEQSFDILRERGLHFSTVTITAKEKLCFLEQSDCNPDACPYARGHYDRVNEAVFDLIHEQERINRETILAYAKTYQVCPFEFCLDATSWVDGIICDYNYVFDPNVRLKRYFAEGIPGDYLFLVDEAHNLVSRAREMYSAEVYKEDFIAAKKIVKNLHPPLSGKIEKCNRLLLALKRECDTYQMLSSIEHFIQPLIRLYGDLEVFMEEHRGFDGEEVLAEFFLSLWNFLNIYERVDDHYRIYTEHQDGRFMLRLLCVNPAKNLEECLSKGNSTIFFSATFLPIRYYKELLRGQEEDYAIYVESPFQEEKRLLCIGRDVSSKYTRRGRREYEKIVRYIHLMAEHKKGNYIVFFPSYTFMQAVHEVLMESQPAFTVLMQENSMNEEMREIFLQEFEAERQETFVALCVMGGLFSEGIDLEGDKLIGTIIVGTGLPMVATQGEILRDYFLEQKKDGFAFAYRYPGMNKVLQAAGRVIRRMEDEGVILLLDDRFLHEEYQSMFPKEWYHHQVVSLVNAGEIIDGFWAQRSALKKELPGGQPSSSRKDFAAGDKGSSSL